MTSPPTLRHLCENAKAHGYDSLIISTQVLDESLDAHAQQIATLTAQVEQLNLDLVWHRDCRPNRAEAVRRIAEVQATVNQMADAVAEANRQRDAAEARATTAEREREQFRQVIADTAELLQGAVRDYAEERSRAEAVVGLALNAASAHGDCERENAAIKQQSKRRRKELDALREDRDRLQRELDEAKAEIQASWLARKD